MKTSKSCLFSFASVFLPGKMIACFSGSPQFSLNKQPFFFIAYMFEQVTVFKGSYAYMMSHK